MNFLDAITLLDNICAQVSLSREAHEKVKEAIKVIRDHKAKEKE